MGYFAKILLLLNYLTFIADGLECRLDTSVTVSLLVADEGSIESANYPNEYPPIATYCDVTLDLCTGCRLHMWQEEMKLSQCLVDPLVSLPDNERVNHDVIENKLTKEGDEIFYNSIKYCRSNNSCEFLTIHEANQQPIIASRSHNKNVAVFSDDVIIRFCYAQFNADNAIRLRRWKLRFFVSDDYSYRYTGNSGDAMTSWGYIYSPSFPFHCCSIANESITYFIESRYHYDCIVLLFDDLVVSGDNVLKIYSGPSKKNVFQIINASNFESYKSFSSRSNMLVELLTGNGKTSELMTFFKASFRFIGCSSSQSYKTQGCKLDTFKPLSGGRFNINSQDFPEGVLVDCTFTIFPILNSANLFANIKIVEFLTDNKGKWSLEIHKAHHSEGDFLAYIASEADLFQSTAEYNSNLGLHLRLRGNSSFSLHLSFSYMYFRPLLESESVASDETCHLNLSHAMIGFPCLRDGKCIPANLTCDGTGHCGYWEDEDLITCKVAAHRSCPTESYQCFGGFCVDGPDQCYRKEVSTNVLTAVMNVAWYHTILFITAIFILCFISCLVAMNCRGCEQKTSGFHGKSYLSTVDRDVSDTFIELHEIPENNSRTRLRVVCNNTGSVRRLSPIIEQSPSPNPVDSSCLVVSPLASVSINSDRLLVASEPCGGNFIGNRRYEEQYDDGEDFISNIDETGRFDVEADVHSTVFLLEDSLR